MAPHGKATGQHAVETRRAECTIAMAAWIAADAVALALLHWSLGSFENVTVAAHSKTEKKARDPKVDERNIKK